ncbi:tetratricopeptide repeat protein [Clostridium sardiniense]|uniref:Tetratricopeptide repeat protein n=1 Tax=Clostridium sardiniense TaxID=29369 RepID=A0ABS7KWB9_CLOSR|nr:tetratricopeptide repeat protein [Clostridium sardiniense]MBY0754877.1 tetratricopeptide repeat protein [Clostridium sardiniense]MDQ0461702.1 tetratricopeptide (TPR) repeat protein [Clostridium sardiniense]
MDYKALFKEKLSKLLFLEIDQEGFKKSINIPEYISFKNKELFIPISSEYITSNIQDKIKIENLPIYYFIEGMLLTLGADKDISYSEDYKLLLMQIPESEECGKSLVAKRVQEDRLEDAHLILKGLIQVDENEEYMKKLLLIGISIREKDSGFEEVLLEDIDEAKKLFNKMKEPYLYKGIILKDKTDYQGAKVEINEYLRRGGEQTPEIEMLMNDIENVTTYEKAVKLMEEEPEKAIGLFLSLLDKFQENPLIYYYLGVSYRKVGQFEKAIYYLLESLRIESGILEVVNELGLNYACIGNYEEAIKYFKKAFEASREVEICTNIIMCYLNSGNLEDAKLHLRIAKELNKDDEIVQKIEKLINKKENK